MRPFPPVAVWTVSLLLSIAVAAQQPAAGLRIVVVAGEDAVNIIQQKSAVAPIVEVRDRNDQPVAGAVVRFAIRGGRATFGGSQTLTVTTDAVGRAAAAGFSPTGAGVVQIGASATFQGEAAATVTITQSNVMTAAQAAAGSASGGSSGAGTGAGAGASGGGGISATTLGIVGAAVAGGAVAANEVLGNGDGGDEYRGSFSGQTVDALSRTGACAITVAHSGTVTLTLDVSEGGGVSGSGEVNGTMTTVAGSAGCPTGTQFAPIGNTQEHGCCDPNPPVSGSRASLGFTGSHPGGAGTHWTYEFTGALNEPNITGTFTLTTTYADGAAPSVRVFPMTLTRNQR